MSTNLTVPSFFREWARASNAGTREADRASYWLNLCAQTQARRTAKAIERGRLARSPDGITEGDPLVPDL